MSFVRGQINTLVLLLTIAVLRSAPGQTYKVTPDSSEKPPRQTERKETGVSQETASPQKSLGWGSNIQNARLGRAAEQALKNGNYGAAVDHAQRAAQAAPDDPQLWFLLGYAARLDKKLQLSIDAYHHGLRLNPSSLDGLSGLAQTYGAGGQIDEAEQIVNQVLAANPKRSNDSIFLGEILVRAQQYQRALSVLGRMEQLQPGARSELLMAIAYERMQQFDQAKHYLDLAKRRAANNPEVQRSLAAFYRDTGNYPAAIAALRSIGHRNPDLTAELAYTYQLYGKTDESAKLYSQAADAVPGNLDLQLSAAQAEVSIGAPEAAQPFLKRCAALDGEHYRLHAIRGEIARLEENDQEAVREFNAAVDHLPQAPREGPLFAIQLHMNLVELYKGFEDQAAAHRHLEIAQQEIGALHNDDHGSARPQFLALRSLIKMNAGDLEGAESDIHEALALNPKDPNSLQLNGDLLVKLGHREEAIAVYRKILNLDPLNQLALISLGSVSRDAGHDEEAEKYFLKLIASHPKLYVPYLALGDMYTARRDFAKAEPSYRKAYDLAPHHALIVAGGMNAAIEAHHFPLAAEWLGHATPEMLEEPHVMREKERYLSWIGQYQQSADVGQAAMQKLPLDRDVVVYLGYDLLRLERYDELQQLTTRYDNLLPKEPDIPLLAGYVYKHAAQLEPAQQAFTRALDRDPTVVTAYVNRGFVRNDLHQPAAAATDFEAALRMEPKNGEAHLGLAYASLDLHRPRVALQQVQLAEQQLGDSLSIHLIQATAYGEEGQLTKAASEYREALKYSPNQSGLHLALAEILYGLHQYREAIAELVSASKSSPNRGVVYAELALCYAQLQDRAQALESIQLAEKQPQTEPEEQSTIFLSNGEALRLLGEHDAAMQRFEKALDAASSDRISVRLAIAKLMAGESQWDDARRQIALAFMEARVGETSPPTGQQFLQAADVFLATRDYQLAQDYFQRALAAGAPEMSVRIGLANSYLALGDTPRAEGQISSLSNVAGDEPNYQYLLAKAHVLRQQQQTAQALTAFAQAASAAGEDETVNQELLQAAGDEGLRINHNLSVLTDFSVAPVFEDTTVYPLDAALDVTNPLPGGQSLLPLPRSSLETQWTSAYHLHFENLPPAGGFFQVRNARGQISLPSANTIVNRDTTDYSFNFGLSPSLRLGNNIVTFNSGFQETIRRDSSDPVDMDQNLFRQFVYLSTSSFFNIISVKGYAIREAGPFTLRSLRSRDLSGALDFRIGTPWGKTALVTGWGARDLQFFPTIREFYYTSAYLGMERKISDRLSFRAVVEDVRAWRVDGTRFATAQALRPAGSVHFVPARNWSVDGTVAYSRNMGFHAYDAVQSGIAVSYAMPIHHTFKDEGSDAGLRYPIHFSAGIQQESFFNFPANNSQQFRPYVRISIF